MISKRQFDLTTLFARQLAIQLRMRDKKIVFAESCTAGLASAMMAQIPGISNWLCGSAVTYRQSVKNEWLQIEPQLIEMHTAVSAQVTEAMAQAVLRKTTEADLSIGITGHLESDATEDAPLIFVSCAERQGEEIYSIVEQFPLIESTRSERQWGAVKIALEFACRHFEKNKNSMDLLVSHRQNDVSSET